MYNVSKRTIQFVCNPDAERRVRDNFKKLCKNGRYYDREKHNKAIADMRKYKQKLYLNKELEIENL